MNSVEKNPKYIALNRFKKSILDNNEKSVYSNLKEAPIEIKNKYNIIQNIIKNRINEIKKKENLVIRKEKEYLNKYIKSKKKPVFEIQRNKYDLKNIIIGPDKLNNICQSKDFSIGRTIKMEFGNEKEKNNLKKEENKIEKEIKTETTTQNTQLNEMLPKLVKRIKSGNKSNLYIDTDTAETNTHLNRNNSALERNKSFIFQSLIISKFEL